VSICLDGWTKKGLSYSFLGISACFFEPNLSKVCHVLIGLATMSHPHTGDAIAKELISCLTKWGIDGKKVLMVVTDNGANIVKAVGMLDQLENDTRSGQDGTTITAGETCDDDCESSSETESETSNDEDGSNELLEESDVATEESDFDNPDDDEEGSVDFDLVAYRRMPCMAHTLQLAIKKLYGQQYENLISKTRALVGKIRKSSKAVESLIKSAEIM
jgi:hypothetical protein